MGTFRKIFFFMLYSKANDIMECAYSDKTTVVPLYLLKKRNNRKSLSPSALLFSVAHFYDWSASRKLVSLRTALREKARYCADACARSRVYLCVYGSNSVICPVGRDESGDDGGAVSSAQPRVFG